MIGVISGFNPTRLTTTVKTVIGTAGVPAIVTGRLVANGAAAILYIHNSNNVTSAATQVAILKAAINSADELGAPIRCDNGVTVKMSVNSATAFLYIR